MTGVVLNGKFGCHIYGEVIESYRYLFFIVVVFTDMVESCFIVGVLACGVGEVFANFKSWFLIPTLG